MENQENLGNVIINKTGGSESQTFPEQSNPSTQELPNQSNIPSQPVYVPQGIPAEIPNNKSGRAYGIGAIICGVLSVLVFPPILGITGILLGNSAVKRGEKTLGLTAIILSSVFMTVGIIFGIFIYLNKKAGLPGAIFPILY